MAKKAQAAIAIALPQNAAMASSTRAPAKSAMTKIQSTSIVAAIAAKAEPLPAAMALLMPVKIATPEAKPPNAMGIAPGEVVAMATPMQLPVSNAMMPTHPMRMRAPIIVRQPPAVMAIFGRGRKSAMTLVRAPNVMWIAQR